MGGHMLKMLTASTVEVDSPADAAAEILEQLDLASSLRTHAVGVVSCSPEFMHSGVVEAICAELPFPVVGAATIASGTNKGHGLELLSICVFTSDEVSFTPALSDPLTENCGKAIKAAYQAALFERKTKPALILAYAPFLSQCNGEGIVNAINEAGGGTPVFGTIGCDQTSDLHDACTIFNGRHYHDRLAIVLVAGPISPKYYMVSVSDGNIQKQKGIITDSEGNILKTVNDVPCVDYMASIGLSPNDGLEGSSSIPFLVDYNDGSPPSGRSVYTFTPEGYAICGGEMPINAAFAVGLLDSREITLSSGRVMASIMEQGPCCGLLVISCIGRSLALGLEPLAEMEAVRRVVGDALPLHMSYSGGEICPVYTERGDTANRFHNFTLIACLL